MELSTTMAAIELGEHCDDEDMIRIRLGCITYDTPRRLLSSCEGSMFAAMFTIQMKPGSTDSSDAVIIERDPVMFSYILRSLEGDEACLLELSEVGLSKLIISLNLTSINSLP